MSVFKKKNENNIGCWLFSGIIQQEHITFHKAVSDRCMEWTCLTAEHGSSITERHSHSSCYHDKSLYVFGGCTSSSTTFNDLWRFELATQQWIRPLALGWHTVINISFNISMFSIDPSMCPVNMYFPKIVIYGGSSWSGSISGFPKLFWPYSAIRIGGLYRPE